MNNNDSTNTESTLLLSNQQTISKYVDTEASN